MTASGSSVGGGDVPSLCRADDLATDTGGALAVSQGHPGHVAHFEVDLNRRMLRMADTDALEARSGANRQGRVGHQRTDALQADVDHARVEA